MAGPVSAESQRQMAPLRGLVPIAHVADVQRSIDFYRQLGFREGHTLVVEGRLVWAWLANGIAHLMVGRCAPSANLEDVVFYLYAQDVVAYHDELEAKGVKVSAIGHPPYMQAGEFCVTDPDGYCLLIGQADQDPI